MYLNISVYIYMCIYIYVYLYVYIYIYICVLNNPREGCLVCHLTKKYSGCCPRKKTLDKLLLLLVTPSSTKSTLEINLDLLCHFIFKMCSDVLDIHKRFQTLFTKHSFRSSSQLCSTPKQSDLL